MQVSIQLRDVARFAHEINAAFCRSTGDDTQQDWENTRADIQDSAIAGVALHLIDRLSPEQSHQAWMAHKLAEGWKYGEKKDLDARTHPALVPYEDLPAETKIKDFLFKQTVDSFRRLLGANELMHARQISDAWHAKHDGPKADTSGAEPQEERPAADTQPAAETTTDSDKPAADTPPVAEEGPKE